MARHPRWVRQFVSEADLEAVRRAISEAEAGTSAEIRVHLDHGCPGDPIARATAVFQRLGMDRTPARNGVLVYVAIVDRKLAVIGDRGIHERVGETYWQGLVSDALAHFREERPRDGLLHAVAELGAALRQHFPRRPEDRNELQDEVSIGG
jgi:uncharacterized membrane protein